MPRSKSSPTPTSAPAVTLRGRVLWFDDAKGFGFICPEGQEPGAGDVFAHWSAIAHISGRRLLLPNQIVEFERLDGQRGPIAHNIRVVQP